MSAPTKLTSRQLDHAIRMAKSDWITAATAADFAHEGKRAKRAEAKRLWAIVLDLQNEVRERGL